MSHRSVRLRTIPFLFAALALVAGASTTRAQVTLVESGFTCVLLSDDLAKQIEIGVGPDTCLYYGSFDGLKKRCAPYDPGTVCDPALTFPVGIAFGTGGSFGSYLYVADYGLNDIHRSSGCAASTTFATLPGPGSIAFPPSGSPYGDYLYGCYAFDGPIVRISPTGVVTNWLDLEAAYLRFGPGGTWTNAMYVTTYGTPEQSGIARVSSAGVVTPIATNFFTPEGFDWGFDGDLFATDASLGQVLRIKPNGTKTLFATLSGAADVQYRAHEQALYLVSNQGGLYRITRTGVADGGGSEPPKALAVTPNPTRGSCELSFTTSRAGLARIQVFDAAGRIVRRWQDVWFPAGRQSFRWDARDDRGLAVRAGTYFTEVATAGERRSARVVLVR